MVIVKVKDTWSATPEILFVKARSPLSVHSGEMLTVQTTPRKMKET